MINTIGEEQGVAVEIAPTENFGFDRFIAEANEENSTWDSYGGVTPFLEMIALVETGTIEPWDEYLPEGMHGRLRRRRRGPRAPGTASSTSGRCCSTSACRRATRTSSRRPGSIRRRRRRPGTSSSRTRARCRRAALRRTGWSSTTATGGRLIPVTHSISTDVYTPDGLFRYNSEPAIQALEILRRMMELTIPDVLAPGEPSSLMLVDEAAFTGAAGGLLLQVSELAAAVRFAVAGPVQADACPAPGSRRRRGRHGLLGHRRCPIQVRQEQAAGGRVLRGPLDRRAVLAGTASSAIQRRAVTPAGQLPVLQSVWTTWEDSPPEWITANPWTWEIYDSLADASAIAPSILGDQAVRHGAAGMAQVPHRRGDGCQDGRDKRDGRRARRVQAADRKGPAVAHLADHSSVPLSLVILRSSLRTPVGPCGRGEHRVRAQRRGKGGPSGSGGCARRCGPGAVPARTARTSRWNSALDFLRTYPYLLPAIIFFLGWQLLPIYDALRISFTDDKFLDQAAPNWIGLQNYRDVLHDPLFWEGIKRAFIFTVIFVPGMIFIPMAAAVCIDRVRSNKLSTVYRVILLDPCDDPGAVDLRALALDV